MRKTFGLQVKAKSFNRVVETGEQGWPASPHPHNHYHYLEQNFSFYVNSENTKFLLVNNMRDFSLLTDWIKNKFQKVDCYFEFVVLVSNRASTATNNEFIYMYF